MQFPRIMLQISFNRDEGELQTTILSNGSLRRDSLRKIPDLYVLLLLDGTNYANRRVCVGTESTYDLMKMNYDTMNMLINGGSDIGHCVEIVVSFLRFHTNCCASECGADDDELPAVRVGYLTALRFQNFTDRVHCLKVLQLNRKSMSGVYTLNVSMNKNLYLIERVFCPLFRKADAMTEKCIAMSAAAAPARAKKKRTAKSKEMFRIDFNGDGTSADVTILGDGSDEFENVYQVRSILYADHITCHDIEKFVEIQMRNNSFAELSTLPLVHIFFNDQLFLLKSMVVVNGSKYIFNIYYTWDDTVHANVEALAAVATATIATSIQRSPTEHIKVGKFKSRLKAVIQLIRDLNDGIWKYDKKTSIRLSLGSDIDASDCYEYIYGYMRENVQFDTDIEMLKSKLRPNYLPLDSNTISFDVNKLRNDPDFANVLNDYKCCLGVNAVDRQMLDMSNFENVENVQMYTTRLLETFVDAELIKYICKVSDELYSGPLDVFGTNNVNMLEKYICHTSVNLLTRKQVFIGQIGSSRGVSEEDAAAAAKSPKCITPTAIHYMFDEAGEIFEINMENLRPSIISRFNISNESIVKKFSGTAVAADAGGRFNKLFNVGDFTMVTFKRENYRGVLPEIMDMVILKRHSYTDMKYCNFYKKIAEIIYECLNDDQSDLYNPICAFATAQLTRISMLNLIQHLKSDFGGHVLRSDGSSIIVQSASGKRVFSKSLSKWCDVEFNGDLSLPVRDVSVVLGSNLVLYTDDDIGYSHLAVNKKYNRPSEIEKIKNEIIKFLLESLNTGTDDSGDTKTKSCRELLNWSLDVFSSRIERVPSEILKKCTFSKNMVSWNADCDTTGRRVIFNDKVSYRDIVLVDGGNLTNIATYRYDSKTLFDIFQSIWKDIETVVNLVCSIIAVDYDAVGEFKGYEKNRSAIEYHKKINYFTHMRNNLAN